MKRIKTILLAALALVMLQGGAVQAGHTSGTVYFGVNDDAGEKWSNTATEAVCMTQDWWNTMGLGHANNAAAAAAEALERWRVDTQVNVNFNVNGQPGCSNFGWDARYVQGGETKAGFCNLVPSGQPSTIHYEFLGTSGPVAQTIQCDLNNNDIMDYFSMVVNASVLTENGTHWNFEPGSSPTSSEWDAGGVFVHEAGHAIGYDAHYQGTPVCNSTASDWNTMCANANGYFGETWSRTLESHDIGEANEVY